MAHREVRAGRGDGEERESPSTIQGDGVFIEREAADGPAAPPARRFHITDLQKWLDLCA
jgi:hypothetical protein